MKLFSFVAFLSASYILPSDARINAMNHAITIISPNTFDSVIRKNRDTGVSSVLFYGNSAADNDAVDNWYNKLAIDLQGMVKVAGINCIQHAKFCKDQNVSTFPTVLIYPPNPLPAFPYTGPLKVPALTSAIVRHIPDTNVTLLNADNLREFLQNQPAMPKVLLFSTKERSPVLFNALANSFKKEIHFGLIPPSLTSLDTSYKVTKRPSAILIRSGQPNKTFTGEIKFQPLHDWLNLFRETFVQGGGFSDHVVSNGSAEEKPWLNDPLPELTKASSNAVCLKQGSVFCMVFLVKGEMSRGDRNRFLAIKEKYEHVGKSNYRWMWMDIAKETEWKKLFENGREVVYPTVAVINPHKRVRYMMLEKEANEKNVADLFEKIAGGGSRFTVFPKLQIPEFVAVENKERSKDEL